MKKVSNKTFNSNNPIYNACVGKNGGATIRTYALGYKQSVLILLKNVLKNRTCLDTLVYPIVYNARHYVELSLKSTIEYLNFINLVFVPNYKKEELRTHSLYKLMNCVKRLSAVEPRYKEIVDCIGNFVSQYYEIDDSAETFRFPMSHQGHERHLENQGCINLDDFAKQFCKLTEQFEILESVDDCLYNEYRVGTVVCGLSRESLKRIAKKLPKNPWNKETSFGRIADEIKKEFNLSASQFSKVIARIKAHREFASYYGNEIQLDDISKQRLKYFKDEYENLEISLKKCDLKTFWICMKRLSMKFTLKELAALSTIREIGGNYEYFDEDYDYLKKKMLEERKVDLLGNHLFHDKMTLKKIKDGLEKMGQQSLIRVLVDC